MGNMLAADQLRFFSDCLPPKGDAFAPPAKHANGREKTQFQSGFILRTSTKNVRI